MSPPRLSRRSFLLGSGVAVGLPLLDAMTRNTAWAQGAAPSRFVTTYMGTCTGGAALTNPAAAGTLPAILPKSFASLQPVSQHISIISKLALPIYASTGTPTTPGSAVQIQHGGTISPILSGVSAQDGTAPLIRGHSADQVAADFLGAGARFASLQMRVQAASYNNQTGASAQRRGMSVRKSASGLSELLPIESPQRIFGMLFVAAPAAADAGMPADAGVVIDALARRRSVLDFVLADANRLSGTVGAQDRQRLDQHFTHIRELEQSLSPSDAGTSGGAPIAGCGGLTNPGADPAVPSYGFGGWSDETKRGQNMADMIAYALACDLTRVVSWMLTHDQCWIDSQRTSGSTLLAPGGKADIHHDSHFATADIKAGNANWGAALFGRLVGNLAARVEPGGTLLDRTFLSLVFAEGISAHNKSDMTAVVAGHRTKIRNGVHLVANGAHPAQLQVAGLQAIGMNVNQLGEVVGAIPGLRI